MMCLLGVFCCVRAGVTLPAFPVHACLLCSRWRLFMAPSFKRVLGGEGGIACALCTTRRVSLLASKPPGRAL